MNVIKTDSKSIDFIKLINLLDRDLHSRYEEIQANYNEHNKVDSISSVIIIYDGDIPIACGAYKEHDATSVELKRIYVIKEYRRQGVAKLVVNKLENSAREEGYMYAILETGIKQYEAINLYKSIGYNVIDNYPPYIGNNNSICMKKNLKDGKDVYFQNADEFI
ncbi:GNAT family N-acetyltransferase [Marinisporobacter balticus]|uniref:Acetyltransferase (GNAT) family protein n=1 Tax=Marinisporobacter balticus TaxID=2018667 RepID=A0A4R2K3J6_9FIRM|nr:GNAT family N-acetyltransferase [Marinisporobacter balticus]TCO67711.1 acetyltransferase (GNAT) family protein [Marinisporobacter balticus]